MDAGFERRAMRTFESLLDAAPETRAARLRELCAGDAALEAAVAGLMVADAAAGVLPTRPPDLSTAPDALVAAPERIEEYRLVGEIGRGGMGVVYRGERDDGVFEQQVAIKLIRQGLFSDLARAQFAAERRILARLRHPHIAQLHDGGTTPDGLSYIVMELIEGVAVTDHVAAARCSLVERLRLFDEVCDAVAYAHRMLVVHGDIKPGNVVVDPRFGVKLLDFGIARLLDQPGAPTSPAYTPGYASAERRAGQPLTTGDDIFALGRLLADLIAGRRDADGDLRAIADKAAADAPNRYTTVEALAADLDRWRARLPVSARAASPPHQAALFWRRHRLAVMAGAAVATSLLVAIASLTALWLEADRRYADARATADAAVRQAVTESWAIVRAARAHAAIAPNDGAARRAAAKSLRPLARAYLIGGDAARGCALWRQSGADPLPPGDVLARCR